MGRAQTQFAKEVEDVLRKRNRLCREFFAQDAGRLGRYRAIRAVSLVEVIFLGKLIAQARPEDVLVGISTGARNRKLLTFALPGYDAGEILRRGPGCLRTQQVQASVHHIIHQAVEEIARA